MTKGGAWAELGVTPVEIAPNGVDLAFDHVGGAGIEDSRSRG